MAIRWTFLKFLMNGNFVGQGKILLNFQIFKMLNILLVFKNLIKIFFFMFLSRSLWNFVELNKFHHFLIFIFVFNLCIFLWMRNFKNVHVIAIMRYVINYFFLFLYVHVLSKYNFKIYFLNYIITKVFKNINFQLRRKTTMMCTCTYKNKKK